MKKMLFLFCCILLLENFSEAQNVGIGNLNPTEKLHVDSGSIKIGKQVWSGVNIPLLKFGDGNFLTIGEEEADDKLTIRAKELFIRPSGSYLNVPVSIQGSANYSHFYFGTNEDTYIRGGKNLSNVIINDLGSGGFIGLNTSSVGYGDVTILKRSQSSYGYTGLSMEVPSTIPGITVKWNIFPDGVNSFFNFYLYGAYRASINPVDGSWGSLSDVNKKNTIADLPENTLTKIMQLVPRSYFMNFDSLKLHKSLGFIAQELEEIFPEVTGYNGDSKFITYQYLIPILTKGIQEQQQQIETLQKGNADIKKEVQELKRLILSKN